MEEIKRKIKKKIKILNGQFEHMSNISSVLGLIIAVFALCVSFNAYNLTIRGAKFSTLISTIPDYVEGLKEDGQYGVREGWKNYENGGKSISLKKAKNSKPCDAYGYYRIDDSESNYLCLSILNDGVMASKNVFLKLEFENLYLTPKEGYDSTWQPILDPAGLSLEILGLRYEYDENVLLYPSESRDLYIDLFNNYEMWVDEKGATIKISIVGDNSKLKTQSFKVKLEG